MKNLERYWNNKWFERTLVLLILFAGIFIRAYHFGTIPVGVHQDEAMAAVDAKALAEYGTDRYGMRFPVHFTAWKCSQMSVLLSYCMIPFIKLFGFSTVSIRLPMLVISSIGLIVIYLFARTMAGKEAGLIALLLCTICPWHYMQSRWSLDCNMFPHVFLIAALLLMTGIRHKWAIYVSMIFFGLCCYCYGIADYSVPVFLVIMAVCYLKNGVIRPKELPVCIGIFGIVSLPEYLTMFINAVGGRTIETPLFTIPYFPESNRSRDILLVNFSKEQLLSNIKWFFKSVWLNGDLTPSSVMQKFGPLYFITKIFFVIGFVYLIIRCVKTGEKRERLPYVILLAWIFMGLWIGLVTKNVLIHKINSIFYPIVITAGLGIKWLYEKKKWLVIPVAVIYTYLAVNFGYTYFREWSNISRIYYFENFFNALEYIKEKDSDIFYLEPRVSVAPGDIDEVLVTEILTMYAHEIDARYFQGVTNIQGGQELLPYRERYRYEEVTEELLLENENKNVLYLVTYEKLPLFDEEKYRFEDFYGYYYVVERVPSPGDER